MVLPEPLAGTVVIIMYFFFFFFFLLHVFWDSIYRLCQVSVHREGVNPNSMEGVLDLSDHISVGKGKIQARRKIKLYNSFKFLFMWTQYDADME